MVTATPATASVRPPDAARRRRWLLAAAIAIVLTGAIVPAPRHGFLQAVGRQLVHEDAVAVPAYIALLSEGGEEALLEVVDLAARSAGSPVILFDVPSPVAAEYVRRGVTPPGGAAAVGVVLQSLGVSPRRIRIVRAVVGGTNGEVAALAAAPDVGAGGAIVASWHHSARLHRVVRRAFDDVRRRPAVVISRYGREWEQAWWRDRGHLRAGLTELQKLLLDIAAHPLS